MKQFRWRLSAFAVFLLIAVAGLAGVAPAQPQYDPNPNLGLILLGAGGLCSIAVRAALDLRRKPDAPEGRDP